TAASALETAIKSALAASGNATSQSFADKVTVEAETIGAGSSLTIKVSGLGDGETFVLAEGTNNPLAALGIATGDVVAASGDAALFQVGANADETIEVSGVDLASLAAGITGDVLSAANATAFITAMDDAIADVSEFRGTLGAVQNRFESTINNLQVTTENLAASESRIRDTDMALEMVSFTRHQILMQAGTAMLGQANQLPQGVLRLLG